MISDETSRRCFADLSNLQTQHNYLKNINNQLGGLDSGITGDILNLNGITNRMIVDGWVITNYGDILVDIQGPGADLLIIDAAGVGADGPSDIFVVRAELGGSYRISRMTIMNGLTGLNVEQYMVTAKTDLS